MKAKLLIFLLFAGFVYWLITRYGSHFDYGYKQLKGQFMVIYEAEPIERRLADPEFPDSLRQKIDLIVQVKKYAIDSLGFMSTNNYSTYFQEPNHTLLWMLTGCKPYAFEEKEWCFPLVGCFGYKGFFDSTAALQEIENIKKEGFEPDLGPVAAWSTLGILPDPILSSMLKKEDWKLIQLVFHELTHTVIYAKNAVDFNENLANFVADKATRQFIRHQFPNDTAWHKQVAESMNDRRLFLNYMFTGFQQLDSLYKSMNPDQPIAEKERMKSACLDSIFKRFTSLPFRHPERFNYLRNNRDGWTNNMFLSYRRYDFDRPELEAVFNQEAKGNLKLFVANMKTKYGSRGLFDLL